MQDTLIGYLHGGSVEAAFHTSLVRLLMEDGFRTILGTAAVETGPALVSARNDLARLFLSTEATWLFMVDTDMAFEPDVIERLKKVASPKVIAGGLCFVWWAESRIAKPTMFDENMKPITEWKSGELVPVYATGAACLLIHRRVFESTPEPWFTQCPNGTYGEDQGFCRNMQAAGIRIVVDTSTPALHSKRILVGPNDYDPARLAQLVDADVATDTFEAEQSEQSGTM